LSRNIDHFSLAIYLVPLPCTVALLVASGRIAGVPRRSRIALTIGCALVGLNYTYYAFFACFLILVSSLVVYAAGKQGRDMVRGLTCVAVISMATAINLAPSAIA
jgi:hypothetical protein